MTGRVRMVCAEEEAPYDRPPLSKGLLAGTVGEEEVAYRPRWWYEEKRVELLLGARAEGLDPERRTVRLDSGAELGYESLLIATGGAARELPFLAGFENVHSLRTLADARRLRGRAGAGRAAGDRRRRLHRPGGRGDGARPRGRGDDDRGAGRAAGADPRRGARAAGSPGCTSSRACGC